MRQRSSTQPRRNPRLGRFLGFELVLNDRRQPGRRGEGGNRRTLHLAGGLALRLLRTFLARRHDRPRPLDNGDRHLDRPA